MEKTFTRDLYPEMIHIKKQKSRIYLNKDIKLLDTAYFNLLDKHSNILF